MSLKRDGVLITFMGLGLAVGLREWVVSHDEPPDMWQEGCQASAASCYQLPSRSVPLDDAEFWKRHEHLTEVLAEVNPGEPDTEFMRAMQALADGREEEFARLTSEAVEEGAKHNDILLRYHAQYLLDSGAPWHRVNFALNRWRENHPRSPESISMRLGAGPASQEDAADLLAELARAPWVEDARLTPPESEDDAWRLWLYFRPAQEVDIRDAVAAASLLSIPPEERGRLTVTCSTLRDCRVRPR